LRALVLDHPTQEQQVVAPFLPERERRGLDPVGDQLHVRTTGIDLCLELRDRDEVHLGEPAVGGDDTRLHLHVMGVDVGGVDQLNERQAEVIAVTVDHVELMCL